MKNVTKQYNKIIPILIHNELSKCDYKRKDDIAVIIDTIYRSQIYFKNDLQKKWGYSPVAQSVFLKTLTSSKNIKPAIEYAINEGWIKRYGDTEKCDGFYIIGNEAKKYKIQSKYLGTTKKWLITDKSINTKIGNIITNYKKAPIKNLSFSKSNYFKTFSIQKDDAFKAIEDKAINEFKDALKPNEHITTIQCLNIIRCDVIHHSSNPRFKFSKETNIKINNILHRVIMQQMQVQSINEGYLFFKRNKTNGRLDTNLTSLPGYLKQFIINAKDENLVHLDIKNSQPFFFYTLLKNNKSVDSFELEKYKNLVLDGNLYEYLIEEYFKVCDSKSIQNLEQEEKRNYIKKLLFKIFYSKVNSYKKYKDFFGGIFPTIMEVINEKNQSVHNTLAIELQTMESFTIIDKLLINLQEKNILPLTIHDSFLCSESEVDIVLDEINNVFTTLYGCVPKLHYDVIGKPVVQDDVENETKDIYADLSFEEFLDIINSEDFIPTLTEDELFEYDIYIPNDKKTLTIEELLQVA